MKLILFLVLLSFSSLSGTITIQGGSSYSVLTQDGTTQTIQCQNSAALTVCTCSSQRFQGECTEWSFQDNICLYAEFETRYKAVMYLPNGSGVNLSDFGSYVDCEYAIARTAACQ